MKSIKEKAEAYDKVLEWATEAHKVCDGMLKEDLEHLFPELKDSEDERIRRVIRGWIYTRPASFFDNGISKEEMLAWLEKKGNKPADKVEQKPAWSKEDNEMINAIRTFIACGNTGDISTSKGKMIIWLKSLKDRYTWRPTKEQLRELRCVISGCSFETPILVQLEEDLKKLL